VRDRPSLVLPDATLPFVAINPMQTRSGFDRIA
jgi:hypothetical protein